MTLEFLDFNKNLIVSKALPVPDSRPARDSLACTLFDLIIPDLTVF